MKLTLALLSLLWISCAQSEDRAPVRTVDSVDIEQYMGTWYEIARFPQFFQRNCGASQAQYELRQDGRVNVVNTCKRTDREGDEISAKAIAKVVDKTTNAKLSVSFLPILRYFGWFGGDYWILELGEDYEYAVVGSPNRQSLWFLSRTPTISDELYEDLKARVAAQGFALERLERSPVWE